MTTDAPSPRHRRTTHMILGASAVGAIALLALVLFLPRMIGPQAVVMDGPSMEPTYADSDRFLVTHAATYQRGDVVVVASPADGARVVKRIVAVEGDRIRIEDDRLYVNDIAVERRVLGTAGEADEEECIAETLGRRTWVTVHSLLSAPESMAEMTVPAGRLFLLGDHRDRSNDSRNPRFGFVAVEDVVGLAGDVYIAGTPEIVCPSDPASAP
jgi:signal peptidase I